MLNLVNPSIRVQLFDRLLAFSSRPEIKDRITLRFAARLDGEELTVNGVSVTGGSVIIRKGPYQNNEQGILGFVDYIPGFSHDVEFDELLKQKEEHVAHYGEIEPFPLEHLIHPATFEITIFVDEKIIEELLHVDETKTRLFLHFTFDTSDESIVRTEYILDEKSLHWNASKREQICADSFSIHVLPKQEDKAGQERRPNKLDSGDDSKDTGESETAETLKRIEQVVRNCFIVLVLLMIFTVIFRVG